MAPYVTLFGQERGSQILDLLARLDADVVTPPSPVECDPLSEAG